MTGWNGGESLHSCDMTALSEAEAATLKQMGERAPAAALLLVALNLVACKASWAEEPTFVVIQCRELGVAYWCRGEAHVATCRVQTAGGAWSSCGDSEMKLLSCEGKACKTLTSL